MERGERGQGEGEKSTGRWSSVPDPIGIGHPSPGNSHHGPFVARVEMSAINSSALNTEPITLRSILECDACGAPSQNYNDLHPAPSLPTNVTEGGILEATDHFGYKYELAGTVKYKNYANYQHRLASFLKSFSSAKTAEELADTGFLYHSAPDSVICFCCGVGFKEWRSEDQPLREHAVNSPSCSYMQLKSFQIVPQQLRINASATSIRTNSRFCQEERPLANGHNGKSDQYSSNEEVFPKCMTHITSAFSTLTLSTGVQYLDDSASSVMERKINQELTDMGYSSETIQLAIRCVQRKGAEMNLEVVANTILDMDQKKTNRAASLCYLCQRDFRNGYTLCPCGHLAICLKCNVDTVALCPLCAEKVERYVRTYPECKTRKP